MGCWVVVVNGVSKINYLVKSLDAFVHADVPGLQYVVVGPDRILMNYANGWADLRGERPMTESSTLMAYSMTKTITAIAVLQLVQEGIVGLDDDLTDYLPYAYIGRGLTIRRLLSHTSGVPNPIPLGWVHLASEHAIFDEDKALRAVLQANPNLAFDPGKRYLYSNIGYWLIGKVVERMSGRSFLDYVAEKILKPLEIDDFELGFSVVDHTLHSKGYVNKYSFFNLIKNLVLDKKYIGDYEGGWLEVKSHYVNGPAFGGLVGTATAFGKILQDQLKPSSVLLNSRFKSLLCAPQFDNSGRSVPMTLGWHVRNHAGRLYFFKEGGGGGFHAEMRLYPTFGIGTVVMTNSTNFKSSAFLDRFDVEFIGR